jgi:tellurium resistance protein TerD
LSDPVILTKGGNVNLSKTAPGSSRFVIGLGWNPNPQNPPDLDAAAYLCDDTPHLLDPVAVKGGAGHGNFVYFHNLVSADGAVLHGGDNLTGDGDGDDERILIDTSKLDPRVKQIIVGVAIYDAKNRGQTFGLVRNAYVRVYDAGVLESAESRAWNDAPTAGRQLSDAELKGLSLASYDLEEDAGQYTAFQFGVFYQTDAGDWKFKALGTGAADADLGTFVSMLSPETAIVR